MVGKPSSITTAWGVPKITALLEPLAAHEIVTKQLLQSKWATEPSFLLKEVLMWIRPDKHADVRAQWPPVAKTTAAAVKPAGARSTAAAAAAKRAPARTTDSDEENTPVKEQEKALLSSDDESSE